MLNYYEKTSLKQNNIKLTSRGLLVHRLLKEKSKKDILNLVKVINFKEYAPCIIFVLSREATPFLIIWDGEVLDLQDKDIPSMLTSSSYDTAQVKQARKTIFNKMKNKYDSWNYNSLYLFHSYHDMCSYKSVCMHREDAETVSFSHISVNHEKISFNYKEGALCHKGSGLSKVYLA